MSSKNDDLVVKLTIKSPLKEIILNDAAREGLPVASRITQNLMKFYREKKEEAGIFTPNLLPEGEKPQGSVFRAPRPPQLEQALESRDKPNLR